MLLRKRTLLAIAFAGTSVVADPSIARATDSRPAADYKAVAGLQLRYRNETRRELLLER